jgi:isopenicillin-N epimerase
MRMSMAIDRREFITKLGVTTAALAYFAGCKSDDPEVDEDAPSPPRKVDTKEWEEVRDQFSLSPDYIHLSALYISSHPKPVREAIETYRKGIDSEPVLFLNANNRRLRNKAKSAAASYLNASADEIAITDSTTMGLGLIYNGLRLKPGDEIVTSDHDYYVTHESLRTTAKRTGANIKQIKLYDEIETVSVDEIVSNIEKNISSRTRVLALTFVHSNLGLKLPIGEISKRINEINSRRDEADRVLICVDGVHGFGVEDITAESLGCDFFIAGCHKWLFGPRGTGIVWGKPEAWGRLIPTIPSFSDDMVWSAWLNDEKPDGPTSAETMTPGGFKAFEHQWAISDAFEFIESIGKGRIEARTHQLAGLLKEGLAEIPGVNVKTPMSSELSAGIVCFEVEGKTPHQVVQYLRRRRIIASTTPYATVHARLTPSIRNTPAEIESVLNELKRFV